MTWLDWVRVARDFAILAGCIYMLVRMVYDDFRFRRRK